MKSIEDRLGEVVASLREEEAWYPEHDDEADLMAEAQVTIENLRRKLRNLLGTAGEQRIEIKRLHRELEAKEEMIRGLANAIALLEGPW